MVRGRSDIVSPEVRSRIMAAVPQSDTSAELAVRRLLWHSGVRYRVSNRDLPGSPDIANRSSRWAIFVHGCFWHGHTNCTKTGSGESPKIPVSNREYWTSKISKNRERDKRSIALLREQNFRVLVVWECELANRDELLSRLLQFVARGAMSPEKAKGD